MSRSSPADFAGLTTIRSVGGLVPADLLARIIAGTDLPGLSADNYRLEIGVSPREAANRAWSVLTGAWAGYREALATRPDGDRATGLTRDKWLSVVLRELGFGRVPVSPAGGIVADERSFPVSHCWGDVPVHLLGWGVDLDRKTPGVAGAAERAPHAMVQELLNRSDEHLWALLANGGTLRLLRDSSSMVGQSFVEFDLQAMFDGEVFSDFAVLFLLCHFTRFEPVDSEAGPEDCWLERWRANAVETGARALGALRLGVKSAIEALGTGFVRHPANSQLRQRLEVGGGLDLADYHRGLLRLVYRLLFCFVAEDRGLLLDPGADAAAKERYRDWFSTARLRRIATRRRGTRHGDLWQALSIVIDGLGAGAGRPELAIPGIGGLFEHGPADVVTGAQLGNDALLACLRHLCVIQPPGGGPKRTVDYRNLGAEELGGIYESLLEFVPRYDPSDRTFTLESLVGNERKTSGAYYTPTSLIDCLLDSALDPLLDEAERADDPSAALLGLTVCDPACGSGHFLVAAARRIAARLARVRADGGEPTLLDAQAAMHDVVGRCIYGVDINPMAAELAKVSLWLEALQPGRPLSFLDAHIKVGNALLGTTPALLAQGIPDEAFTALEGDDKKSVTSLRKRNREDRDHGVRDLFASAGIRVDNRAFADAARRITAGDQLSLADIHLAQRRQVELDRSPELRRARLVADAWCAAFVIEKAPGLPSLTHANLERLQSVDLDQLNLDRARAEVERLAARYRFFHWHLEFPHIFHTSDAGPAATGTGWTGGFSCVVGNPPWERIKLAEQEFFAAKDPDIAGAPNAAARKKLIKQLAEAQPALLAEFEAAKRQADAESHVIRNSGRFPLCGRGDINTYAVFAETDRSLLGPEGRLGVILPTGIATDATTQHFFRDVVQQRNLVSLFGFYDRGKLFEGADVHGFCLLTIGGRRIRQEAAEFAFFTRQPSDLLRPDARFRLTPEEITLLNPNTGTCPVFRSRRDAEITLGIYRRVPVLIRHGAPAGNPWGVTFMTMFHMSNDSHLFHTAADLEGDGWVPEGNHYVRGAERVLPLYEGKLFHHFDHRWATYESDGTIRDVTAPEHGAPQFVVRPRYWVAAAEVNSRLSGRSDRSWLLGFRNIARSTDERTIIASSFPIAAVGHSTPLLMTSSAWPLVLLATSLVFDYVARQKVGGTNMTYNYVQQFASPLPQALELLTPWDLATSQVDWLRPRALELTYTAWDMEPFAWDLGDNGPPFRWADNRRTVLRAELDGAFFHIYGIDRDEAVHILETFPVVHRNDRARHGEARTQRLVLEAYDHLSTAIASGEPFVSTLDPPPGHGLRHPPR